MDKASLEHSRSGAELPALGNLYSEEVHTTAYLMVDEDVQDHQLQPEKAT